MKKTFHSFSAPAIAGAFLLLFSISGFAQRGDIYLRDFGPERMTDRNAEKPSTIPGPTTQSSLTFTDITMESGLAFSYGIDTPTAGSMSEFFGGGVGAGDFDGDGDIDLYFVAGDAMPNCLFENLGNNRFVEVAGDVGLGVTAKGSGPTFADIDGDYDLDLFIGGVEGAPTFVFRNEGGFFEDMTALSGISFNAPNTISAAFGDYDRDGDLDLFASHWGNHKTGPGFDTEHLWQNQGDGTFRNVSLESGISDQIVVQLSIGGIPGWDNIDYTFSPNFADIDNDGFCDVVIAADFGTSQVFHNNGDGTFTRVTDPSVIVDENGMGATVADYDNDGDLDWFVTAIFKTDASGGVISPGNRLYRNLGNGQFEDVTLAAGVSRGGWGWGSSFADFNNDGHLDIFHTNGWAQKGVGIRDYTVDPVKLFISNGDGTFTNQAAKARLFSNGQGRGVVTLDSDQDGDLDILITNNDSNAVVLYRNDYGNKFHYLNVRLLGKAPNTQAVGARIYLTANGMTQMRELSIGTNYASQNPMQEHFGLAAAEVVETVRVVWGDGEVTLLENVRPNQFITINHPGIKRL